MRWGLDDIVEMREAEMTNDVGGAMPVVRVMVYDFCTSSDPEDVETTIIIQKSFEVFQETNQLESGIERSVEVEDPLPSSARSVQDEVIEVSDSDEESAVGERRCTRSRFTGFERPVQVTNQVPTLPRRCQNVVTIDVDSEDEQSSDTMHRGFERPVQVTNQVPTLPRRCQNVVTIVVDSEDEQSSDTMHRERAQEDEAGEKGEEAARDGLSSAAPQGFERPVQVTNQVPTLPRRCQNVVTIDVDSEDEQSSDTMHRERAQEDEAGEKGEEAARDGLSSAAPQGFERPVQVTNQVPTLPRRCQNVVTIVVDSEDEQSSDTMHRERAQEDEAGEKGEEAARDGLSSAAPQGLEPLVDINQVPAPPHCFQNDVVILVESDED